MAWAPEDDARLVTAVGHEWTVPGVQSVPCAQPFPLRAFRLPAAVGAVVFARVQAAGALALTGGDGLVRDFVRQPTSGSCTTLGLEQLSAAMAHALAESSRLARVHRLVVRAPDIAHLEAVLGSRHATRLEALTIVGVTPTLLRALVRMQRPVHTLRIDNTGSELHVDLVAEVLGAITARLTRLELRGLGAPLDVIAGNPAFEGLGALVVDHCQLRGAELLGSLRELRLVSARDSSFDDVALGALAGLPHLTTLLASGTQITDDGMRAVITVGWPRLQALEVDATPLDPGTVDAVVHATTLPDLARLTAPHPHRWLPAPPRPEPGTRDRMFALAAQPTSEDAYRIASQRGWWPRPPLPADRRFFLHEIYLCEYCRGLGPCDPARHRPTYEPRPFADSLPPGPADVVTIARTQRRFEAAEAHVIALARLLGTPLHLVAWHLFDAAWTAHHPPRYPPRPYDRLVDRSATCRWPRRRAGPTSRSRPRRRRIARPPSSNAPPRSATSATGSATLSTGSARCTCTARSGS